MNSQESQLSINNVEKVKKKTGLKSKSTSGGLKLPPMSFGKYIKRQQNSPIKRNDSLIFPKIDEVSKNHTHKIKRNIKSLHEFNIESLSDLTTLNNSAENLSNRRLFIDDSLDNTRIHTEKETEATRESTVGGREGFGGRQRIHKLTLVEKIKNKLMKNAENTDFEGIHESI